MLLLRELRGRRFRTWPRWVCVAFFAVAGVALLPGAQADTSGAVASDSDFAVLYPAKQQRPLEGEQYGGERDFFPLGPLGVSGMPTRDGRGIEIRRVLPAGGAAAHTLRTGDTLIGIGEHDLTEANGVPPLRSVAAAIRDAQLGEGRHSELTLTYRRGNDTHSATVQIPTLGRDADLSGDAEEQQAARERARLAQMRGDAVAWLVRNLQSDGSLYAPMGATNGRVVVTSVGILALIGAGSSLRDGSHRRELASMLRYLQRNTGDDPLADRFRRQHPEINWYQTHWAWGLSGWALAELQYAHDGRRSPAHRALTRALSQVANGQQDSGGWGHGPGEQRNSQGYVEFAAMTAICTTTLGLGGRLGLAEADEEALEKGVAYLVEATTRGGGVRYAASGFHGRDADVGRTAVALLALRHCGKADADGAHEALAQRMAAFIKGNLADLEKAHAGYLLHLLQTGLACRGLANSGDDDTDAWDAFWAYAEPEITLARQVDGTFAPRPTPETQTLGGNLDIALGEAWPTTVYATLLALALDGNDALPLLTSSAGDDE